MYTFIDLGSGCHSGIRGNKKVVILGKTGSEAELIGSEGATERWEKKEH